MTNVELSDLKVPENKTTISRENVPEGSMFVSQKNMIYKLKEWGSTDEETPQGVLHIWPSGNMEDVLNHPVPDGEHCVKKTSTIPVGETVWLIDQDPDDITEPEDDQSESGISAEVVLLMRGPREELMDILEEIN